MNKLNKIKIKNIIISSLFLLILDGLWLGFVMNKRFGNMITDIQKSEFEINFKYAILAFICMIILLNYFIIHKNLNLKETFLLGSVVYAIFDFTCLAIFKNYKLELAIIDMIWGGILFSVAKLTYDKLN